MPATPQDLAVHSWEYGPQSATVTLRWVHSDGSDVTFGVNVTPSLSSNHSLVTTPAANVQLTLNYNEMYAISVFASNCVGDSSPATISISAPG